MTVKFSCVVDIDPRFAEQALVWASSLLVYGAQEPESLVIHTVGECAPEYRRVFDSLGIEVCAVQRFDKRHPNSNKLGQLASEALGSASYVVLCDCDIAFCGDISSWITGDMVRARVASWEGVPPDRWEMIFQAAGLKLPTSRVKPLWKDEETLPTYCNGGLYIIPNHLFCKLRETWPRWDRWLLDHRELVKPFGAFVDQISFCMSCEELGLTICYLPLELNFDGVSRPVGLRRVVDAQLFRPLALHYHQLNERGFVPLTHIPSVNREIRKVNELIALAERTNFHLPTLLLLRDVRPFEYEQTQSEPMEA